MRRLFRSLSRSMVSPLEGASCLRHIAIALAVIVAWAMRRQLTLTNLALAILAAAALVNFATSLLATRPAWVRTARVLSAAVGIGGWAALVFATGGLASPFIAGLWLEIVFSALIFPPTGTLLVTGVVAGALWTLAEAAGGRFEWERIWLQTGFVGAIGAVTFLTSKGWAQAERRMTSRAADLDNQLRDLEGELVDARELGRLGEGAARFAHGLKGAVHSLRGFTKLMEGAQLEGDSRAKVIEGLHLAIDRVDKLAQTTLRPPADAVSKVRPWATAAEVERTLDEVVEDVGRRYDRVRWVKVRGRDLPGVPLSCNHLRDVMLILAENAAEASGVSGEVTLHLNADRGMFHLMVRDRGPGLAPQLGDRIFRLGTTTKPTGHGYGLFLAKRLVESRGGRLTAAPATGGGALVSVTLPLQDA